MQRCDRLTGEAAGRYLLARGCVLPHPDGDLRWHPALPHPDGYAGPALVGLVTDALTGIPTSLHRTWLAGDGSGSKAAVDRPQLLLAGHRKAGGCLRLWPDIELTDALGIAEDVETALTLARVFRPVWALIDASNLGVLPLLSGVGAITVATDHDAPGLAAFAALAERWTAASREVRKVLPPTAGHDLNDWACHA